MTVWLLLKELAEGHVCLQNANKCIFMAATRVQESRLISL